jgi:hypothetical protein
MLARIKKPYRVTVSDAARAAGFEDRSFPNKRTARAFVRRVQQADPLFNPPLRITFRYHDTTTGSLYATRFEYETEEARRRDWLQQSQTRRAAQRNA